MDRRAKCKRTVQVGLLILISLGGCSRRPDPAQAFKTVQAESQRGDFIAARAEARDLYVRWASRPDELWHWKFKLLYAEMLLLNGETRKAEALLSTAPTQRFSKFRPRYKMLNAYVCFRMGETSKARALAQEAIVSASAASDFETEAEARVLLSAYASPDDADSEKLFGDSLALTRQHNLPYQSAALLLNLGLLRIHQSRFGEAVTALEQAEEPAHQAKATLLHSVVLGNLATCYRELGNFDRAIELRQRAISMQEHAGLDTLLRDSYLELGIVQLEQGDTSQAVQSMRHALRLTDDRDSPAVYSLIAKDVASALIGEGDLREAQRLNDRAKALAPHDDVEGQLWVLSNEAQLAERRGNSDAALQLYRQIVKEARSYPSLKWSVEASLARILAARGDASAFSHYEAALETIESSRAEQIKSAYEITFLSSLIRFYQDYVRLLVHSRRFAQALLVADSSRASVLGNAITNLNSRDNPALIAHVQLALEREHAAVLFYFLAPGESYLWVVTGRSLTCIFLPGADEITNAVRSYRQKIEVEKIDPTRSGAVLPRRLFEMLVAPALPAIVDRHRIVIVADGALHHLNFETLLAGGSKPHYWIEDVTLSIAPSLKLLTGAVRQPPRVQPSLLLVGDPISAGPNYPSLAFAATELEQVRAHFPRGRTTELKGSAAVPSAFRSNARGAYQFIHVAAHAESNEDSPLDSAIILSPERDSYRVYAREFLGMRMQADLVVLSACRSAGSRTYSGEGPVGFVWTLFQSGVSNVAASLWDVSDRSTALLMNDFYTEIDRGEDFATALRAAKLKQMRLFPKPYYWAPFQLYARNLYVEPTSRRMRATASGAQR